MSLPQRGINDMKSPVAVLEPLFDERAKHPVLLVEAIEKSANMTLFAKHAISDVDGTFIASHDVPPREWIPPPTWAAHSMKANTNWPRSVKSIPPPGKGTDAHPCR